MKQDFTLKCRQEWMVRDFGIYFWAIILFIIITFFLFWLTPQAI